MTLNYKKIFALGVIAVVFAIIGWVLPIIEFTPTTYINATHIYSTGLTNTPGDNVSLISDFDNLSWTGNETNGIPWIIDIVFENVSHFDNTESMLRYFSSSGTPSTHQVDFEIFCTMENAFTNLHTFTNENDFSYFPKKFPESHHFIFPNGTVILRLNHTSNGNVNHRIWIDSQRLVIQPQYEQVNPSNITTNNFYNTTTGGNVTQANLNLKVNKSGDTMTGNLTLNTSAVINASSYPSYIAVDRFVCLFSNDGINTGDLCTDGNSLDYNSDGVPKLHINGSMQVNTTLDMQNHNITNCANCQVTGHGLARAYLASNQNYLQDGVLTKVTLNSTSFNPYGEFNTNTGNYTVKVDGYYDIVAMLDFSGSVVVQKRYIGQIHNNDTIIMTGASHSSISTIITVPMSDTWKLNAGDNITMWAYSNSGNNLVNLTGGIDTNWMSISLKSKVPP